MQVKGEILDVRRVGAYSVLSITAPGLPERTRPGHFITVGIGGQYVPRDVTNRLMARFSRLSPVAMGVVIGFVLLVINTLGPRGVAPFIYFRF